MSGYYVTMCSFVLIVVALFLIKLIEIDSFKTCLFSSLISLFTYVLLCNSFISTLAFVLVLSIRFINDSLEKNVKNEMIVISDDDVLIATDFRKQSILRKSDFPNVTKGQVLNLNTNNSVNIFDI